MSDIATLRMQDKSRPVSLVSPPSRWRQYAGAPWRQSVHMSFRTFSLVLLGATGPSVAFAQDLAIPPAPTPILPVEAASAAGFTPRGWALDGQRSTDLNGDGRADLVFVIHGKDPRLVLRNEGLGTSEMDTNPRVLVVAFARAQGGYRRVLANGTLITRRTQSNIDDVWEAESGLTVGKGVFRVRLNLFANAGGWSAGPTQYTFRWQNGRFEMIGYDSTTIHRGTGEVSEVSINYSTGRVKLTSGNIEHDQEVVRHETLKDRRLRSIDEIGDGLEFDPGYRG